MEKKEWELDTGRLLRNVLKKAWVIGLAAVLCGLAVLLGSLCLEEDVYCSNVVFYVDSNGSDEQKGITPSELDAARELVDSCLVILKTGTCMDAVAETAGVELPAGALEGMIRGSAVGETEFFRVEICAAEPETAKRLAEAVAQVLPEQTAQILQGVGIQVVDGATQPQKRTADHAGNTAIALLLGALLGVTAVTLWQAAVMRKEETVPN